MGKLLGHSSVLWNDVGSAIPWGTPKAVVGTQAWEITPPEVANSEMALVLTIFGWGRIQLYGSADLTDNTTWFTIVDFETDAADVADQGYTGLIHRTTRVYTEFIPRYLYVAGSRTIETETPSFGLVLWGSVPPVVEEVYGFGLLDPNI